MNIFLRFIYNIGLFITSFIYLFKYLLRGRSMKDLLQRFYIPKTIKQRIKSLRSRPVWFHGVSVGEINVLATFLKQYHKEHPDTPIVVSTITPTGHELALLKLADYTENIFYFPLDIAPIVSSFCKIVNPLKFIAMETELWPELYMQLSKRGTKICILNGRLSDKSFPSYLKYKKLLTPLMDSIDCLGAQNEEMKERFTAIGLDKDKITVTGNIKYAIQRADTVVLDEVKEQWSFLKQNKVLLAGSTHEPEETYILSAYKELKKEYPELSLVLCPRHVERARRLTELCLENNFNSTMFSEMTEGSDADDIFILDKIGYLSNLYSIADIAIIGGSFIAHGGQNILEAAVYSKPIIFGPHMHNFEEISKLFIDKQAAIQAANASELYTIIKELLTKESYALNIGDNAFKLVNTQAHSVAISSQLINQLD